MSTKMKPCIGRQPRENTAASARIMTLMVTICLVIGSVYLMQASLINAKALVGQWLIANAWEKTLHTGERHLPWPWADTYPVAKLNVPRFGRTYYVLQGASGEALSFGPGLNVYSSEDGAIALFLIQAHMDTHFDFLGQLEIGDIVELFFEGRLVRFKIAQHQHLSAPRFQLTEQPETPLLVLSTCMNGADREADTDLRRLVIAQAI